MEPADEAALLRAALESSDEGILVFDRERRVRAYNRRLVEMLHIPEGILAGGDQRSIADHLASQTDDPAGYLAVVERILEDPHAEVHTTIRFADGRVFERRSAPQYLQGEPVGRVVSFRDVSAERRAEAELRSAELRFRTLAERLPAVTYIEIADERGITLFVSPQIETILGIPPEEWIAGDMAIWLEAVHPDDRERALAQLMSAYERREPYSSEYRMIARDGSIVHVRDEGLILPDPEGGPDLLHGLMLDISALKEAEERATASSRLLEAVSRAQSSFIASSDPAAVFESVLESLLDLTGSGYGFVGEVLRGPDGGPFLRTHAISNIAWNEETRDLFRRFAPTMEFRNVRTLFGEVMRTGEPVIANDPASDPRRGGLPEGHPPLDAFLGVPLLHGGEVLGMAGVANRPGGYGAELVTYLEPFLATCGNLIAAFRTDAARRSAEEDLRLSEARVRALLDRLVRAQEDERARIAEDIHDDSIQAVTSVGLRLGVLKTKLAGDLEREAMAKLEETIGASIHRLRHLLFELRPRTLDQDGLAPAIALLLERLREETDLATRLVDELEDEPSAEERLVLFRIAQEAIANVRAHALATSVEVVVRGSGAGHLLEIRDDGVGFDPSALDAAVPGHLGLSAMRERAEGVGGWLRVDSSGAGTAVIAWVPARAEATTV
jgi:PAS domain S-box-containing protein